MDSNLVELMKKSALEKALASAEAKYRKQARQEVLRQLGGESFKRSLSIAVKRELEEDFLDRDLLDCLSYRENSAIFRKAVRAALAGR